jgi:hypothetical protein
MPQREAGLNFGHINCARKERSKERVASSRGSTAFEIISRDPSIARSNLRAESALNGLGRCEAQEITEPNSAQLRLACRPLAQCLDVILAAKNSGS